MAIASNYFYHNLIRKYATVVGSLLSGLTVHHFNTDGNLEEERAVKLTYSPKEKFIAKLLQDGGLEKQAAINLPHIGYQLVNMNYDPVRKFNSKLYFCFKNGAGPNGAKTYMPQPWNFEFEATIITKTQDDMFQIIEQIAPFFGQDFTVKAKTISSPEVKIDIPITLNSVQLNDTYEGSFEDRRMIISTLRLTLRGFLFSAVKTSGNVIRQVDVSLFNFDELTKPINDREGLSLIHIEPYFEGKPIDEISIEDNYEIKTTITS